MLEFALSQETARTAPLLPPEEGREENPVSGEFSQLLNFCFCHFLNERAISFFLRVLRSMGRQCATPCFLTLAHDPSCQQPRECGSGTQYLPTHLWPVPFGTQGAQFDSATRFSSPGDHPSSTAFSRLRWQSGMPLSCARRLLSSLPPFGQDVASVKPFSGRLASLPLLRKT